MAWNDIAAQLKAKGFTDQEIEEEKSRKAQLWARAQYSQEEIDEEFYPEKKKVYAAGQAAVKQKLQQQAEIDPESFGTEEGLYENFTKGLGMSSSGVLARRSLNGEDGKRLAPDPKSFSNKVAYTLGQITGDMPTDLVGRITGGLIGAGAVALAAPAIGLGVGAVAVGGILGQGFGSASVSEFIRNYWTDAIDAGETDKNEAVSKLSMAAWEATKAGTVGALTLGVGTKVRNAAKLAGVDTAIAGKLTGEALKEATARVATKAEFGGLTSELATAVTAGAMINGELPEAEDFLHGAAVVGSLKATGIAYNGLKNAYRKTGVKPLDLALAADKDTNIKEDLLSVNKEIPTKLRSLVENKTPEEIVKYERVDPASGEVIKDEIIFRADEDIEIRSTKDAEKTNEDFLSRMQSGELDTDDKRLNAAVEAMAKHVTTKKQAEELQKEPFNLKKWGAKTYQLVVDELHTIKSLDPATYVLARNTRGFMGKGLIDLNVGFHDTVDFTKKSDPVRPLYKDFSPEKFLELNMFLAASQSLSIAEQNPNYKIGVPKDVAKTLVELRGKEYSHIAEAMTNFGNTMLKEMTRPEISLMSPEGADTIMKSRLQWVPLTKLIQYNDAHVRDLKGVKGQKQVKQKLISSIEATLTQAPIEAFEQNVHLLNNAMGINRVKLQLLTKHGKLFKEMFSSAQEIYEPTPELADVLSKHGIDQESLNAVAFALKSRSLKPGEVDIYENGRRKIFQVSDPLLADSMNHLHAEPIADNLFMTLSRKATEFTRTVTGMPDFVLKQLVVDKLSQAVLSDSGNVKDQIGEAFRVGFSVMNQVDQEYFQKYLASGGLVTFIDDFEVMFNKKSGVQYLQEKTGFLNGVYNVVRSPLDLMKLLGQTTELNTRLVEFNLARAGSNDPTKISEAAFKSRDIALDFQRKGASNFLRSWNAITAFQNAGIQGLDKVGREVLERPTAVVTRAASLVTAATVLNWQINKDDELYQNASDYEKFAFWVVPYHDWREASVNDSPSAFAPYQIKNGEDGKTYYDHGFAIKIPKPGIIGHVFGSSVEIALNNSFAEDSAGTSFSKTVELFGDSASPFGMPNILSPAIGGFLNRNMQTGHALVPEYTMGLLPQARYADNTTETSKFVSRLLSGIPVLGQSNLVSPAVLDYTIQQWGGRGFLELIDMFPKMTMMTRPEVTLAEVPFVKTFLVKNPTASNSYVMRAMEIGRELEQQIKTANKWVASGSDFEREKAMQILSSINDDPQKVRTYGMMQGLRELGSAIHFFNQTDKMTKAQKRESIDRMYYLMHELAKSALGVNQ
jgi:hypothetical protein